MKYYLVIHDVLSFHQRNNWIGNRSSSITNDFKALSRGDGLVYYCKDDHVITGTFRVKSPAYLIDDDEHWKGPHVIVDIKPIVKAQAPFYVSIRRMLNEMPESISIFPNRKLEGIKLRGRTLIPITKRDFEQIGRYIRKYKPEKALFSGPSNDSGLGEPRDYMVMNYAPTSEQGVVALFVGHMKALGFEKLEFIRQGFPDACAIQKSGSTFERKFIEFEYKSMGFRDHIKNPAHRNLRCDYVVCWEHNFLTCPVPVIELKSRLDEILAKKDELKDMICNEPVRPKPKNISFERAIARDDRPRKFKNKGGKR